MQSRSPFRRKNCHEHENDQTAYPQGAGYLVGSGGSLTGYAGGVSRKEFLLALEKNAAKKNNTPLPPDWQAEGQP